MKDESPFTLNRFEYEPTHLYYLVPTIMERLEDTKPTYVVGKRGTGKTTLLKALSFSERLQNTQLKQAMGGDSFARPLIGLYLKLSEFEVAAIDKWLGLIPPRVAAPLFGMYIDLCWLQVLAEAISELLLTDQLTAPPAAEQQVLTEICETHPVLKPPTDTSSYTFRQLARALKAVRARIEGYARAEAKMPVPDIQAEFPCESIGALGKEIGAKIAGFCNSHSQSKDRNWYFKICIDEAECLSPFQQKVMNTLLRLSAHPVSFVVSYIRRMDDITSTVTPNLTLQAADRYLLELDDMTREEFRDMAEGIATVRVQARCGSNVRFSAEETLGKLNINSLLWTILRQSEKPAAAEWLRKAEALEQSPPSGMSTTRRSRKKTAEETPPIYEAYLVEKLHLDFPNVELERKERRRWESGQSRKKMVAAYLSLCRELSLSVMYAYEDMVFDMSDMCVRDFLAQINEIYLGSGLSLLEFLKTRVQERVQDRALKKASSDKARSVPDSGVKSPREIERIVMALGEITQRIQTEGVDYVHLRATERGIFALQGDTATTDGVATLLDCIEDAADAGFFVILDKAANKCRFRVHCSLAANFGFSYRGAYYDVPVMASDLELLRRAVDPDSQKKAIDRVVDVIVGQTSSSTPLFDGDNP